MVNRLTYMDKLVQLRKFYDSNIALARDLGVDRKSISRWLKGVKPRNINDKWNITRLYNYYQKLIFEPSFPKPSLRLHRKVIPVQRVKQIVQLIINCVAFQRDATHRYTWYSRVDELVYYYKPEKYMKELNKEEIEDIIVSQVLDAFKMNDIWILRWQRPDRISLIWIDNKLAKGHKIYDNLADLAIVILNDVVRRGVK